MSAEPSSSQPDVLPALKSSEIELFSVAGMDGHLREVNDAFARLLGRTVADLADCSVLELVHPDELTAVVTGLAALEAGAPEVLLENRFRQSDGRWIHLQWVARPVAGSDLWWAAGRNTTAFHRLLAEGVDLRARLDLAVGQTAAAMWELDIPAGVLSWEPRAAALLGVSPDALPTGVAELIGVLHADDATAVDEAMNHLVAVGHTEIAVRVRQQTGVRYLSLRGQVRDRTRRGKPLRAVGLLLDVTDQKAMEEQMLRMILTDALTGVPNRRAFDQTLRAEWRRCTRAGVPLSIVMIDVDDFKRCNDTFGHFVGDDVLCAVSRALTNSLHRPGDSVARFGGEEFAVILPGVEHRDALTIARRLVEAIRAVTVRQASGWNMTVSAGTASWAPSSGPMKPATILTRADAALYLAKSEGKNRAVCYETSFAQRASMEQAISYGLEHEEFELYYQPITEFRAGQVVGFEALIRWNRPGHGIVSPDDFIPTAEASPLICDLGRWVFRQASKQLAAWLDQGMQRQHGKLRIAVNASVRHIADPAIVTDISAALAASGLAADRFELELTETALADDTLIAAHLAQVRQLGVSVSIDDFGTGHTSIGTLPHLPVDVVKIDRSFVASTDPRHQELTKLMIAAAHAFDLAVIAEGIEDTCTLESLRALGCDQAQGYLIAEPMPASDIPDWMARRALTRKPLDLLRGASQGTKLTRHESAADVRDTG